MKQIVLLGVMITTMVGLLTGCSDPRAANDNNIQNAVKQYLSEDGALCLQMHDWPLLLEPDDLKMITRFPKGIAGQMAMLEQAGVVSSEEVIQKDKFFIVGSNISKRYQVTAAGKKFLREKTTDSAGRVLDTDLCYAKKELDNLSKWERVPSSDLVIASYTYKVNYLADWAKTPEFKAVFEDVAIAALQPQPEQLNIKLDAKGWQAQAQ